jgi:hypothetical protein
MARPINPFTAVPLYWEFTCWASHFSIKPGFVSFYISNRTGKE